MNPNQDPRIAANQLYREYLELYWSETALNAEVDAAYKRWEKECRGLTHKDAMEEVRGKQ